MILNETAVAYFKLLSRHSPGQIKENQMTLLQL
jgi:hypothetical protein